ncbi:hypothetical protein D3C73_1373970 [compost metagenome]
MTRPANPKSIRFYAPALPSTRPYMVGGIRYCALTARTYLALFCNEFINYVISKVTSILRAFTWFVMSKETFFPFWNFLLGFITALLLKTVVGFLFFGLLDRLPESLVLSHALLHLLCIYFNSQLIHIRCGNHEICSR